MFINTPNLFGLKFSIDYIH